MLFDPSKQFDVAALKDKVVIVHYWSSQSDQYKDDFARLTRLMKDVGAKQNVELVCVSLDDSAARAKEAIQKTDAPGIHLYQAPPKRTAWRSTPAPPQARQVSQLPLRR
ncbi:MAG: thioredoxin-like domain-containing protein [Terriglobales bacterium]